MEETPAVSSGPASPSAKPLAPFTPYQKFVVGILAFLQFTIILDFMILSPLGAVLMPAMHITPAQFGLVVSAYAFSAALSGFFSSTIADRFDRKKMLLFFYAGFIVGTLFCGLAPNYEMLLLARMVTGLFGGVIGSVVGAITTDLFPYEMRGRVMGVIQTAFAASQVLGIPLGLYFSNMLGWHAPFIMIVIVSAAVGIVIMLKLRPIDEHLKLRQEKSAFKHMLHTLIEPWYIVAFITTGLMSLGGFMMMPFASAFSVNNLGMKLTDLPTIYLVTGLASIVVGLTLGRLADQIGKFQLYMLGSFELMIVVYFYTRYGVTPMYWVIITNIFMFAGVSSRMITSAAITSAIPEPQNRGSFMSISASMQQLAGGVAAAIGGMIVVQKDGQPLENFPVVGNVLIIASIFGIYMMALVNKRVQQKLESAR